MKKIILISGKAESGKDTFAGFLKDILQDRNESVCITHYADYLKHICRKYYGWDSKKDEAGRSLLQKVGNETRGINSFFWANHLVHEILNFAQECDYVIIPDVRFENEISCLRQIFKDKTITVRINRLEHISSLTDEQKAIGEKGLDNYQFDYVYAAQTIDELQEKAKLFERSCL